MLVGMGATILAVGLTALKTGAPVLWLHVAAFMVLTYFRDRNVVGFSRADLGPADRARARFWEGRATLFGVMTSGLYGSWCFFSLVIVNDPFAELTAVSVTVAAMIGIATRNFGIDRLVTLQCLASALPLALGLLLTFDSYHIALSALLLPLMTSFRFLAADVRNMLLNAVHERVAASSLADQLDTALDTMQHGLCMLDNNGVIALANSRAQQSFAMIANGAWVGQTFRELILAGAEQGVMRRTTAERVLRMVGDGGGGKVVVALTEAYHCEITISSRGDRTVLLFEDVTARVRAQERINFMARYDGLTGLPNRAQFTELVDADLAGRVRRDEATPVVLMIVDLDDFKHVNDSLGHLAGDKVLAEAANRLRRVVHNASHVARFGGDEFVVYRAQPTLDSEPGLEAQAMLDALAEPYEIDGERLELKASIGIARVPGNETLLDDLIRQADLALYRAKGNGKSQWHEFEEALDVEYRYRQRLKADLRAAVEAGSLTVVYQPVVDLATRRIAGCEALVRWYHPELGAVAPMVFVPLAEDIGLVSRITEFVLDTACAECARWPEGIGIAINVSGRDLRSDLLVGQVDAAIKRSGLSPERLEIEVTETALIEERNLAAQRLDALVSHGIGLALDDFGTGYSSLSYLNELPFTKLKIDRSFICDIARSERSERLVRNVARLGQDLGLLVTAEGVETEEQLEVLADRVGVDQVQGYLFGAPLPASEIRELITSMKGQSARLEMIGREHSRRMNAD